MARDDIGRIRPLPIQVPLQPGESALSFVRRLAKANHLSTSYLREYLVRVPAGHTAAIDITRLSLVTGRTINALQHVFPTSSARPYLLPLPARAASSART